MHESRTDLQKIEFQFYAKELKLNFLQIGLAHMHTLLTVRAARHFSAPINGFTRVGEAVSSPNGC